MDDAGLRLLGHLLDASHDLAPDELVAAVTRAGRAVDAEDVAIYLVDYEQTLLGFEINPLHNIVHLAIGLAGLAMWRQLDTARAYGWLLAAGYGLTFLYGLFAAGNSDINFLSLNGADNVLHLLSAAAGLATALWPATRTAPASRAGRRT